MRFGYIKCNYYEVINYWFDYRPRYCISTHKRAHANIYTVKQTYMVIQTKKQLMQRAV